MKKNKIGIICCILMMVLLLGTVFFFTLLPKETEEDEGLTYDGLSQNHPSGYRVHEMEQNTDKIYALIHADSVINDWYEDISYEQYQELEPFFSKDQWQKTDDLNYDEQDASVTVSIGYPGDYETYQELLIYADDNVKLFSPNSYYQMPAGTCENINGYLQQYYQKQHDITANLDTFLPDFFAAKYDTYWYHQYGKVLYIQYGYLERSSDEMFCPGSPEMSEELLAAFGDTGQWAKCYYDENLFAGWNENIGDIIRFQCENLYGDDFYIQLMPHDDGRTYFTVNNYTAFLAPSEVYTQVKEILNHYEDQWEVIPLVE